MIPVKNNIDIWRGSTYSVEFVSQIKKYVYDPNLHDSIADRHRSYKENLDYYGFTYEFIDFSSIYTSGKLEVRPAWKKKRSDDDIPLLSLTTGNGGIVFTDRSVLLTITAIGTAALAFDQGVYDLELSNEADGELYQNPLVSLTSAEVIVDKLLYGEFLVHGERVV